MEGYTERELSEILKTLNIDRCEFSNAQLAAFTRQSKEKTDKFFTEFEAGRLKLFGEMLDKFTKEWGGENE